ncbi:MAG TPA: PrsW family glutamic-type intramembrane protease [Thermoanaerobaculia bacterium]|nr:PrsW family glutamic-type intramembrane protease [Thermoanaerobaculia bacterium]
MVDALLALVPVVLFLAVLVLMDSFKLVPLRGVVLLILAGMAAAFVAMRLHGGLLDGGRIPASVLSRYVAPLTEEVLKALPVVWMLARKRIGFLVDAAILGFAVGTGFALVENVEYLRALGESSVFLWIVRGFGTAVLHGGTTSILAVLARALEERRPRAGLAVVLPGLALAIAVHSLFNHFLLPPIVATLALFVTLPVLFVAVFVRSEEATRAWLGPDFDSELETLRTTLGRDVAENRVGKYLLSLRSRFEGAVVADMMCLLRLHLELSIRAKAMLMAREAGFSMEVDDTVRAKLTELRYLERSIGPTGLLALQPMLRVSSRHLWQIWMLETGSGTGRRGRA